MKRRPRKVGVKHLWTVRVRHRDYVATMNHPRRGELHMTETNLFIVARQPDEQPQIDLALSRARAFLRRHQRKYGIATILQVAYEGTIDNE